MTTILHIRQGPLHAGKYPIRLTLERSGQADLEDDVAQAALRDYQHYQGRAAADEADAQGLLGEIDAALAKLG